MDPPDTERPRDGLAERLPDGRLGCLVCQRACALAEGGLGFCRVRRNEAGRVVPLSYGRVAALHLANVERKPLYHFYPGEVMLSVGGLGCNFRCPGCQNRDLSRADVPDALASLPYTAPEDLVRMAVEHDLLGVSWTYNEPAIWFEYTLDGSRLAREAGLMTNYVTNGSLTARALDTIGPYLDAYRVDVKGFSEDTYRRVAGFGGFRGILDVAERAAHKWGMHVECVTNVTPGMNDSDDELRAIAGWIARSLGPDVPWHVTAFAPHGDFAHLPRTPVASLERARRIGVDEGLRFVYLGNVPGHRAENTWCPGCGALLIQRTGLGVVENRLAPGGACPRCSRPVPGRFR
jgi:pyruvate formate lyase activating enzyme